MGKCFFCELMNNADNNLNKYILENELALGRFDDNPVSRGHMLFVTKRHTENLFETTNEEKLAIFELMEKAKIIIDEKFNPDGYNIGVNCGKEAGQSVMHTHVHLIPRYKGDVENPRGGVRGVIPNKQNY